MYLYLNDEFILDKYINNDENLLFLENNKNKIKKVFINHILGHCELFLNKIFNLECEKIFITHDFYCIDKNPQPFTDEIICNNNKFLNKFTKIITQNEKNLNILSQYTTNDNIDIVISELPDYKKSKELIKTNNNKIIIGIIGLINNLKGAKLLNDICEFYLFDNNIEIIVFGDFDNKKNFNNITNYLYGDILELNTLLLKYKPNLLLELSIWFETYSYTLTLGMLINLPILYVKKTGDFTVENRLSKYNKSYSFSNLIELDNLIKKYKQNYFYIIETFIYYNNFWNNLFNK